MRILDDTLDSEQIRHYAFWYYMRHRFFGVGLLCGCLAPVGLLAVVALVISLRLPNTILGSGSWSYLMRVGVLVLVGGCTLAAAAVFGRVSDGARDFACDALEADDETKQDIRDLYRSRFFVD